MRNSCLLLGLMLSGWLLAGPVRPIRAQPSQQERVETLLLWGRELVDDGKLTEAISVYEQAAQLDRGNPRIFSGIGYLHARLGKYAAAANAYSQSIRLAPRDATLHHALGFSHANNGDLQAAAEAYERAAQLEPSEPKHYRGWGATLFQLEQQDAAADVYQRLLTLTQTIAVPTPCWARFIFSKTVPSKRSRYCKI